MAAGNTYEAIATTTLGSATASVTLSSIPSTYTDLVFIVNGSVTASTVGIFLQFNGDTTTNYSNTTIYGDGSTAGSVRATSASSIQINNMTQAPCVMIVNVLNYANSTTYKTTLSRNNNPSVAVNSSVGLWRATPAAITSVTFLTNSSTFIAGTSFTIYGIKAA